MQRESARNLQNEQDRIQKIQNMTLQAKDMRKIEVIAECRLRLGNIEDEDKLEKIVKGLGLHFQVISPADMSCSLLLPKRQMILQHMKDNSILIEDEEELEILLLLAEVCCPILSIV